MDEQNFTPVPAAEQSAEVAPVEQQAVEPVSGTPTPETQQTDGQQRERVADASRVMREQKERNRAAAERRTRDAAEAQAWRQVAQTLAQHLQGGATQAQGGAAQPPANGEPQREGYDSFEAYQQARVEWQVKALAKQTFEEWQRDAQAQQQSAVAEQQAQQVQVDHARRTAEFARAVPDFDDVVDRDDIMIPAHASEAIKRLPNGPAIVYAIGRNPEIAQNFARMGPLEQVAYAGQLSQYYASRNAPISQAAEAGRTVGSKPAPSSDLPEDIGAYMAAANKRFGRG